MAAAYKILICGAQSGHTEEQVASALAPILKHAPAQLLPALRSKQNITLTLTGLDLRGARGLMEHVQKSGCICALDSTEALPPKAASLPGNFGDLTLRPFVSRTVGLMVHAPSYWRDVSGEYFRIRHVGTSTYFTSSVTLGPSVLLRVWAQIRFGAIAEKMAYLKPYREPYSLDTAAGLAIAAEFRGTVPGDERPTHQLVLCLCPESAAISLNITTTVPEFERHQALYQWLLRTQLRLCDTGYAGASETPRHDPSEGQYQIAVKFNDAGQYEEAVVHFRKAAEQGHAEAEFALGCRYQRGEGVGQNARQAFEWWRKAAEQGLPTAQYNLGLAYQRGIAAAPDAERAFHWFSRAAREGHLAAQNAVAACYAKGEGVAQSDRKAFEWWLKAAEQGEVQAQYNVGSMYERGVGTALDVVRAFHWYSNAAQHGFSHAQYAVSICYVKGEGVAADIELAAQWALKAAQQDHADAQFYLGAMHERGEGMPRDQERAISWYRKAAARGNAMAKGRLKALGA